MSEFKSLFKTIPAENSLGPVISKLSYIILKNSSISFLVIPRNLKRMEFSQTQSTFIVQGQRFSNNKTKQGQINTSKIKKTKYRQ